MTIVVDASAVVAALIDDGPDGAWAAAAMVADVLAAPHLMPVEAANILRRAAVAGDLSTDVATLAHEDLLRLRVELFPYEPYGRRVWELRGNLTTYDAWYVSLAEELEASLVTLDGRLARAPGLRCEIRVPPSSGSPGSR